MFTVTIFALFLTRCVICSPEVMGFGLLFPLLMMHSSTFSSVPRDPPYSLFLLFWSSRICLAGCYSHPKRISPWHSLGLVSHGNSDWRLIFSPFFGTMVVGRVWMHVIIVKNLFGDNWLGRPYFGRYGDDIRVGKVFKLSLRFWINLARSSIGISRHFDALCGVARHAVKYGILSRM